MRRGWAQRRMLAHLRLQERDRAESQTEAVRETEGSESWA